MFFIGYLQKNIRHQIPAATYRDCIGKGCTFQAPFICELNIVKAPHHRPGIIICDYDIIFSRHPACDHNFLHFLCTFFEISNAIIPLQLRVHSRVAVCRVSPSLSEITPVCACLNCTSPNPLAFSITS